jgi:PKD repeat protein
MTTQWMFGDSTSGTGNTVTHQYQQSGNYWVCMRTTIGNCVYDTCLFVNVVASQPQPCNLQARFTFNNNGNTYSFFNTSTGYAPGDTIRWVFSNGTVTNVQNPVISFQSAGVYSVCLRIKKQTINGAAPCVSEYCDSVVVSSAPNPCNFNANFTSSMSPTQPNLYQFINTSGASSANSSITWNFGDGTSGTGYSVSHLYAQSGVYNVCIRVVVNNTCIRDTCKTIIVNTACNMIANFTNSQTPNSGNNLTYTFTNTSIGFAPGDSILWTFGDSSAPAFVSNPVHTFPRSGYYRVCLRIKKATAPGTLPCVREVCRTVYVSGQPPINCDSVRVTFTMRRDTYMPNRVYFLASSNYFIQRQSWTITRLSDSNSIVIGTFNPMYTFNQTGTYRVCLRANTSGNCVKEYCDTITINAIAQQCILTAFPNPATSQVSVQATLTNANSIYAFIYNSQNVLVGQRIVSGVSGNNLITFNISNLVSGYYTIRLYHSGQMCLSRFMKL